MNNPQQITTVRAEAIGDGLGLHDWHRGETYVLNATTSLVWQHCDGKTTRQQLAWLLQTTFNVSQQQAEELLGLALDELESAALLRQAEKRPPTLTRRQVISRLTAAGLSLVLMPIVAPAVPALADPIDDDDDHHHHDRDCRTTTTKRPVTSTTTRPIASTTTAPITTTTTAQMTTTAPITTTTTAQMTTTAPITTTTTAQMTTTAPITTAMPFTTAAP